MMFTPLFPVGLGLTIAGGATTVVSAGGRAITSHFQGQAVDQAFSEMFAPCDDDLLTAINLMSTVKFGRDLDVHKLKYLMDWMDAVFSFYMDNPDQFAGTTPEDAERHLQEMVDGTVAAVRSGFAHSYGRLHALVSTGHDKFEEAVKQLRITTAANVALQSVSFASAFGSCGFAWAAQYSFAVKDSIMLAELQASGAGLSLKLVRPWHTAHIGTFANVAACAAIIAGALAIADAIVAIVLTCEEEAQVLARLHEVEEAISNALSVMNKMERASDGI